MHIVQRCFIILLKFTILLGESRRSHKPLGRIYGGYEAKSHSHPYIVSLQMRILWIRVHACGGSILSDTWVLTAAHCVKSSILMEWLFPIVSVVAGTNDIQHFGPDAQVAAIEKTIAHSLFDPEYLHNDIAMLKISTPFKLTPQVHPVLLPVGHSIAERPLVMAGWGLLSSAKYIPDLPRKLQEVVVKHMPHDECQKAVVKIGKEFNPEDKLLHLVLNEKMNVCSAPESRGVSACHGDSGGPLVQYTASLLHASHVLPISFIDETSRSSYPVLVGIASWIPAKPCGLKDSPTIFTRVSNYIDFIKQCIRDVDGHIGVDVE